MQKTIRESLRHFYETTARTYTEWTATLVNFMDSLEMPIYLATALRNLQTSVIFIHLSRLMLVVGKLCTTVSQTWAGPVLEDILEIAFGVAIEGFLGWYFTPKVVEHQSCELTTGDAVEDKADHESEQEDCGVAELTVQEANMPVEREDARRPRRRKAVESFGCFQMARYCRDGKLGIWDG